MTLQVHAYILAGGRSSRFGSDKARATIDGLPLILRLANAVATFSLSITVVARREDTYQDLGLRTIADYEDFGGPVAGLLRALDDLVEKNIQPIESVNGNSFSHPSALADPTRALVLSCDLICWEPAWLTALLAMSHSGSNAIAFRTDRWQPFPGLYHPEMANAIRARTGFEDASMQTLLDDPNCKSIGISMNGLPSIRSANTQDELRRWISESK